MTMTELKLDFNLDLSWFFFLLPAVGVAGYLLYLVLFDEYLGRWPRRKRRRREKKMDSDRAVLLVGVGIVIATVLGVVGLSVDYSVNVSYQYRHSIGAYITNAYDASTFEVMKDNLEKAEGGMRSQGLEPTDCGRAWSWEQTQDWCMAYTYQYIDGLINRTQYYINLFKGNPNSTFTDVYTQAIHNMREEMNRNGPVDWAAYPTWALKYHALYYWVWLVIAALSILFIAGLVLIALVVMP